MLEAITPDQGYVANASEWTEAHVNSAIGYIKSMENADINSLPAELNQIPVFQERVNITSKMMDLATKADSQLPTDIKVELNQLKDNAGEIPNVLVHGDLGLKNVVIDNQGGVLPVDYELAKIGFLAQDTGKLLSGLKDNPQVFKTGIKNYVKNPDGSVDQGRLNALMVGMATENLVHIAWRVENVKPIDEHTAAEIDNFVNNIRLALDIKKELSLPVTIDSSSVNL
jgi:thiamine kinase-like enzyme